MNTSQGTSTLLCSSTNLKFLRFQSVKNKRLVNAFQYFSDSRFLPTQCPPCRGGIASRGSAWTVSTIRFCEHVHLPKWSKTSRVGCKFTQFFSIHLKDWQKICLEGRIFNFLRAKREEKGRKVLPERKKFVSLQRQDECLGYPGRIPRG